MSLSAGTRVGNYELESLLGAGGMGEVYRARDMRLERTVAIKTLAPHLFCDPHLRQRFEHEARAISRLNHPHVCVLHDIGRVDDLAYLVMEYLEGETLADRLLRGRLPIGDALEMAIAIGSALDAAHRAGIVHRDLKPGNVMLTPSGVKLLDFGLAKLQPEPIANGSTAVTTPRPLTEEGALVGTFQYMAPEQLAGKEVDARSDLFAFGAVLYEMLTGRRTFQAASRAGLIAAILEHEPAPMSDSLAANPGLERLVMKCLAKDPDARWQTASDLTDELRWLGTVGSMPVTSGSPTKAYARWSWLGLAAAVLVALGLAFYPDGAERTPLRLDIAPVAEATVSTPTTMALSPDGRHLAWVGGNDLSIWLRSLADPAARRLPETDQAEGLFWSPDSTAIGFFAHGALKIARLAGGVRQRVSAAPLRRALGGTWNREGVILFGAAGNPIYRVDAAGGEPEPATVLTPPDDTSHRHPFFLPDDRHFLYVGGNRQTRAGVDAVYVGDLESTETTRLVPTAYKAAYADGYLLFVRETSLVAQPFDMRRFEPTSEPVRLAETLQLSRIDGLASFTVSDTGILSYRGVSDAPSNELLWLDRDGRLLGSVAGPGHYRNPVLSPDDGRILVDRPDASDIWLVDANRGVTSRFTFEPGLELAPHWSRDGEQVLYSSNQTGTFGLYVQPVRETGARRKVLGSSDAVGALDWARDGRYAVFVRYQGFERDIWAVSLRDDEEPFAVVSTEFDEYYAQFSTDGEWLAYCSNNSGRYEVYAQRFPEGDNKVQLSTNGGVQPRWSNDGKELFYIAPDLKLMAVRLAPESGSLNPETPKTLFQTRIWGGASTKAALRAQYAVTHDGRRFLVNSSLADVRPFTVVLNWTGELER